MSWRLLELIGASLSCLGTSWVCLATPWVLFKAFWGRRGRRPGLVLGSLGNVLEEFQAPLRASWDVLKGLGVSWGRLGLDFRSNGEVDSSISSWMPFSNRYPPDFATKNRSPILEESLNSIGKIGIFCFQALLR